MAFQQIVIVGNVGKDAELSYTPQGIPVAKFNVAVNKVTGRGDDRKEKTVWFRVTIWRERAESAHQYIKKGMKILVSGEIDVSAYTDKNGQPQASLELTARDFEFLSSRSDMQGGGGGEGDYAPAGNSSNRGRGNNNQQSGGYEEADDIPF